MRRWNPMVGGLLVGATLLLTGCHRGVIVADGHSDLVYLDTADEVYLREAPPPPRVEMISARPGADFIWIDGSWSWHKQWIWRSGSWSRRPRHHSVWKHAEWSNEHDGWRYHRGYWKH